MRGHRVERRFGWDTPRPPRRDGGREGARGRRPQGHHRVRHRQVQRLLPHVGACATRRSGSATSPARPAGSTSSDDYKTMDLDLHGVGHLGVQAAVGQGPASTSPTGCMPYSWGAETPLSNFEIRLDDATRPRQDPALTVGSTSTPVDGDPGPMQILAWTTTPWTLPSNLALAVGPDIDYAILEHDGALRHPRRRRPRAATPPSWATTTASCARSRAPSSSGARYEPLLPVLRRHPERRSGCSPATSSTPTRAPASSTSPPASARTTRRSARPTTSPLVVPVDEQRPLHRRRPRLGRRERVRRQPRHHPPPQGRWAGSCATRRYDAQLPALLAHRHADHLPGACRPGTCGSPTSATGWSRQPADQLDPRATSATASSASGSRAPATGRSAATGSGARRSRCGRATTPPTRAMDVYGILDEIEADFGVRPDRPAPARSSTSSTRPNPDDPTGAVHDAARPRGARLLVRVGLDALRPGALPVRERASGSRATSPPTSSSSTSPRPAAGSTRCTCWPPRCSTSRRSAT